jgi:hypothetical protein
VRERKMQEGGRKHTDNPQDKLGEDNGTVTAVYTRGLYERRWESGEEMEGQDAWKIFLGLGKLIIPESLQLQDGWISFCLDASRKSARRSWERENTSSIFPAAG